MHRRSLIPLSLTVALATIGSAAQPVPTASFTQQQADHGRLVFFEHCAECHGGDLQGQNAPALAGERNGNLVWQSPGAVESYIANAMPIGNVGVLKPDELVDVTAFLMEQNGRKPAKTRLTLVAINRDTAPLNADGARRR